MIMTILLTNIAFFFCSMLSSEPALPKPLSTAGWRLEAEICWRAVTYPIMHKQHLAMLESVTLSGKISAFHDNTYHRQNKHDIVDSKSSQLAVLRYLGDHAPEENYRSRNNKRDGEDF